MMESIESVLRDGSYSVAQPFGRPRTRSLMSIPAMVPCVIPWPLSPVATYTFSRPAGSGPMNAM